MNIDEGGVVRNESPSDSGVSLRLVILKSKGSDGEEDKISSVFSTIRVTSSLHPFPWVSETRPSLRTPLRSE